MDHKARSITLLAIAAFLLVLAILSVFFLKSQLNGFDPKRLTLRTPPAAEAELTQTLSTFKYRDQGGQERTLDLQIRYRMPQNLPGVAPERSLYDDAAAAANFRTQTTIAILGIAFFLSVVLTGFVARQSVYDMTGDRSKGSAFWFATLLAAGGGLLVSFDPMGPVVSHDIYPPASSGLLFTLGLDKVLGWRLQFTTIVIVLSGIAAGATIGLVLHFLCWAVRPLSEEPQSLWRRKRDLGTVITLASIGLSLGIGMITTFLGWGANFLSDTSRLVAEEFAKAGGSYWGGMLTIFTLATVGYTASCIHRDIEKAGMSWAEAERERLQEEAAFKWNKSRIEAETSSQLPPPSPPAPPDALALALEWKKKNDLEFDPLRTAGTVVASLGPVLTSILVPVLSNNFS